jgi:putative alpha-1,2-mannosidase
MRARGKDGSWFKWKGRENHDAQGCTESNPWQQGWFVPHDVEGLVKLMGGREKFTAELERFFDATPEDFGWCDSYNHPNEPCHTLPFLFAHSAKPELASKWARKICAKAYGPGPYGLCGNDDVGQMSAWYVLAAIGLNPLCPGDGRWYLTAPLFTETVIRLDPAYFKGGTFTIKAPKADAAHWRIKSARLNGKPIDRPYVTTSEVAAGGVLELDLAAGDGE